MSTVRMCDFETSDGPCGTIFSEREEGWSTGHIAVIGADGLESTVAADFCPDHTSRPGKRSHALPRFKATPTSQQLPERGTEAKNVSEPTDWSTI